MPTANMLDARDANAPVDLSSPYHGVMSAGDRLAAIIRFASENNYDTEYFYSGGACLALEKEAASLLGMAAAAWFPTGVMAQGAAARVYAARRNTARLLLHPTSHLLLHEEESYRLAHGLEPVQIGAPDKPIIAADLIADAAAAFVELPQRHNGGLLPDWVSLQALKAHAQTLGLPLHMDGARLWSCRPFYDDRRFAEICAGFSSVYLSLYKDIGVMGGALLVGEQGFIDDARLWRSRLGGMMVEPWPMIVDALRLLDRRLDAMTAYVAKAQEIAAALADIKGLTITPSPPQVNMFHAVCDRTPDAMGAAIARTADETGVRLGGRVWPYPAGSALEFVVGDKANATATSQIAAAFRALAAAIQTV